MATAVGKLRFCNPIRVFSQRHESQRPLLRAQKDVYLKIYELSYDLVTSGNKIKIPALHFAVRGTIKVRCMET